MRDIPRKESLPPAKGTDSGGCGGTDDNDRRDEAGGQRQGSCGRLRPANADQLSEADLEAFHSQATKAFTVSLHPTGGTDLAIINPNFGSSGATHALERRGDYGAFFGQPIHINTIAVLVICGTQVPVDIP